MRALMPMETISEAVQRLTAAGYVDDFRAEPSGLRSRANGKVYPPEVFRVDEVVRFEGDSDPSEECAVFAIISHEDGTKGTYTVPYGPIMNAIDAEMARRLGTLFR